MKIINDPVYGFISIPLGLILDLIEHPYFQRLRRIKQTSLSHFVYPGALHTRFHHALGAFHLMTQALQTLEQKGIDISQDEKEAAGVAILLHDIGHGPFSHTLENLLIPYSHEDLSSMIMKKLNEEFKGQLNLALKIFEGNYHRPFFHQLISGQLDMDRMDYLNRDSYFTGVHEGVIGYDRLIKMLNIREEKLVVEEKGIYSIEKFLIARRLMYWQVYLHKTVLAAEKMLILIFKRVQQIIQSGRKDLWATPSLHYFLYHLKDDFLEKFVRLDDNDIVASLKIWADDEDELLSYLAKGLLYRKLFRIELSNNPFSEDYKRIILEKISSRFKEPNFLLISGSETNAAYYASKDEISILYKDGRVLPMSSAEEYILASASQTKYFICYPKSFS
jgi:HD superfamily phosphohydrolase